MPKRIEQLSPDNLWRLIRTEYMWGKGFKVLAKDGTGEEVEIDLGVPKEIMRALIEKNGAAFTDALSTVLALASGKNLDVAHVDRDHSFPSHARCITFRLFQGR